MPNYKIFKSFEWLGWKMQLKGIYCSKPNCKKCPHGPYWYAHRKFGRRLVSVYIGKDVARSREKIINWGRKQDDPVIMRDLFKHVVWSRH